MHLLVSVGDASLATQCSEIASATGHSASRWKAGDDLTNADLLVVDTASCAADLDEFDGHVLALITADEVTNLSARIDDFAVTPLAPGEFAARLSRLDIRPDRKQVMRAKLLSAAIESASDVIEMTSPDAVLQYVNPAFERVLGYTAEFAIGKTPALLIRSDLHEPGFFKVLDATLKAGDTWSGVLKSVTRDGRLVHLETTIAPIRDDDGEIVHHVAVKRDITDRIERQQVLTETNKALRQARDAALRASRAKSEFLANMSHELRTPLNAILGYSEIIIEEHAEGDEQMLKDLRRIHESGSHLLALINDVLDISKIEADKVELHFEHIVLSELVETVRATLEPIASKKENEVTFTIGEGVDAISADRTRLQQVLFNLLSNACKFTTHGKVSLVIEKIEHGGESCLEFRVSDTGIGISESQQKKLFQPFVQADATTTRKFGGTGLGLVISKRLCEMMGGDISMKSELGVGTTFTIRLPVDSRPTLVTADGAKFTILLIDDDPNIQDLFSRALSKRGFNVQVASTGTEGLTYAHQLQPDAIVLDVKLPGMNGWEVLSMLKLDEDTKSIPVIMLTIMQQREIGQSLGAVDYLIKPIEPAQLTEALQRHIRQRVARVLVVEDDEATRELICRTLNGAGHTTIEAENGQVALDKLDEANADVVVLDLMMPVMDGFTFLHHLRAHARFSDLPVLVATARILSDRERAELETMVERVIEKNAFSRRELLDRIDLQVCRILERAGAKSKKTH